MRAKPHEGPDQSHPTSSVADRFRTFSPPLVVEVCASRRDVVYRTGVSADFVSWRKAAVSSSLTAVSSLPRGLSAGSWGPMTNYQLLQPAGYEAASPEALPRLLCPFESC